MGAEFLSVDIKESGEGQGGERGGHTAWRDLCMPWERYEFCPAVITLRCCTHPCMWHDMSSATKGKSSIGSHTFGIVVNIAKQHKWIFFSKINACCGPSAAGYAKEMSQEFIDAEMALFAKQVGRVIFLGPLSNMLHTTIYPFSDHQLPRN